MSQYGNTSLGNTIITLANAPCDMSAIAIANSGNAIAYVAVFNANSSVAANITLSNAATYPANAQFFGCSANGTFSQSWAKPGDCWNSNGLSIAGVATPGSATAPNANLVVAIQTASS